MSDHSDTVSPIVTLAGTAQHPSASLTTSFKLRVWPALSIVPITMLAILIVQVVLGVAFAVMYTFDGAAPTEIPDLLMGDIRFIILSLVINQFVLMGAAVGAGLLSPTKLTARLGLVRPTSPLWSMPLIFIGSAFIWGIVAMVWPYVFPNPSDHILAVSDMIIGLGRTNPILLIVLIAILPPIFEELLVRGYMMRRLTIRWGPIVGITLATIAFAVLHMDPQHAIGVIPLGIWCGFVAWRTGSVIPAILCHGANNGCAAMIVLFNPDIATSAETEAASEEVVMATAWDLLPFSQMTFMLVTGISLVAAIFVLIFLSRPDRGTSMRESKQDHGINTHH